MGAGRTIGPISGSTAHRESAWCSTSGKLFEAARLNPSDAAATSIVARIDDLFGIDALARERNLDPATRHALRLEQARPLLEIVRGEIGAARDASLPSSGLGKAANYTLSL